MSKWRIVIGILALAGGLAHLLKGLAIFDLISFLGGFGKYVEIIAGAVIVWYSFMAFKGR